MSFQMTLNFIALPSSLTFLKYFFCSCRYRCFPTLDLRQFLCCPFDQYDIMFTFHYFLGTTGENKCDEKISRTVEKRTYHPFRIRWNRPAIRFHPRVLRSVPTTRSSYWESSWTNNHSKRKSPWPKCICSEINWLRKQLLD